MRGVFNPAFVASSILKEAVGTMGQSLASPVTAWASRGGKGVVWSLFLKWRSVERCNHHVLLLIYITDTENNRVVNRVLQTIALYAKPATSIAANACVRYKSFTIIAFTLIKKKFEQIVTSIDMGHCWRNTKRKILR